MARKREYLEPEQKKNQESFYHKAIVEVDGFGVETLISYDTKILTYDPHEAEITKHWDDWSATTGRHIYAFMQRFGVEMRKRNYESLPVGEEVTLWECFQ